MKSTGLHRYAILTAVSSFVSILLGAAVTSSEGLPPGNSAAAPVWLIEGHRHSGEFATLLIVGLCIWLGVALVRDARRGWLRLLSGVTLPLAIAEAVLGSHSAGSPAPPWMGLFHALLAQLLLTACVTIAVFTSAAWAADFPAAIAASSWRSVSLVIVALVLLQDVLGDAYRHGASGVILHILNAMIVALVVFVAGMSVTRKFPETGALRRATVTLMVVTAIQVMLGFATFILLLMFPATHVSVVVTSVAHVATGALTLAASVVFAATVSTGAKP